MLPGVGSPFLQENVPQAHLPSGAHSALVTMSYVGDGSGERAPLLSPRGAGNLGPLVFRICPLRGSGLHTPLPLTPESDPESLAPEDPMCKTFLCPVYTRGNGPTVRHLCWLPDSSDSDVEEVTMEDIPVISRPPKTHLANRRRGWLASPGPGNLGKWNKIWPLVHMAGCHP